MINVDAKERAYERGESVQDSSWQNAVDAQSDLAASMRFIQGFCDLDQLDQLASVWDALAATRGLSSYEFLGLTESWTSNWTQSLRPCELIL